MMPFLFLPMKRRYFFQLVSALITPPISRTIGSIRIKQPTKLIFPQVDEDALTKWLKMPMQPIHFAAEIPPQAPSITLPIFAAIHDRKGEIQFTYQGGSEPGQRRHVLPILLFQKITSQADSELPNLSPIYLLAHCLNRKASRTFRLDRISDHIFSRHPSSQH
jgi:predicted DNA-binding transcriptional regulator YafY